MDKLTTKQQLFVEAYLRNPNGVQAAKAAGYKGNDKTLSVVASENLAKPCISARLEKRIEEAIITTDEVLRGVKKIALHGERESDQLKGFELLGKHLKMWTDKVETTNKDNSAIVSQVVERLVRERGWSEHDARQAAAQLYEVPMSEAVN